MPHRMTAMRPRRLDVASIAPETVIIGTPAFIALLEAAVAQLRNKVRSSRCFFFGLISICRLTTEAV